MRHSLLILILTGSIFQACSYMPVQAEFTPETIPIAPDYSNPEFWSALPDRKDSADHIPSRSPVELIDGQSTAAADVFYIHPTHLFTRQAWNASLDDEKINNTVDERSVTHQASVFNGSCKVYVPRYRQVTYNAYFSLTDPNALKAFELAYTDVKAAFEYYMAHYNNGRPIIIAGHSQGTTHAKWLLRDYFEGKPLADQLVCAYLIGMPVYQTDFTSLTPCDSAGQTGCYVTWRTYLEGSEQSKKLLAEHRDMIVVHNPINYSRTEGIALPKPGDGGLGRDGETIYPEVCHAQIHEDIVWASRPDVPGKYFIPRNLHVADYNLYWLTMRNNIALRVQNYTEAHK